MKTNYRASLSLRNVKRDESAARWVLCKVFESDANVARHSTNREACNTEKKLTEISSPRRLQVKGADTESLIGGWIDSGETGVLVADGPFQIGDSPLTARPRRRYTTARNRVLRSLLSLFLLPPAIALTPSASPRCQTLRTKADLTMYDRKLLLPQFFQAPREIVKRNSYDLRNGETLVDLQNAGDRFQIAASQTKRELSNPLFQLSAPDDSTAPSHPVDGHCTVKINSSVTPLKCPGETPTPAVPSADSPNERKEAYFEPLAHLLQPDRGAIDRTAELQADEAHVRERILSRLELLEARAGDYDEKLSYRLAWHLVSVCNSDEAVMCTPAVLVWYRVVGCHPSRYYGKVMANRRAMLGTEYNKVRFPKTSALPHPADTGAAEKAPIASKSAAPVQLNPKKEGIA